MEEWGDHTVDDDRMFMKTFNNPIVLGIYIYIYYMHMFLYILIISDHLKLKLDHL